ncbi:MAG: BrnA antitoxin family protein [Pseudomonadota bacterium]
MAETNALSGDLIRTRLAELAERSRTAKALVPTPIVRTRPEARPKLAAQEAAIVYTDTPNDAQTRDEPRRRGPQKTPTKEQISIRLDPDLLAALRAGGRGWQSRLNDKLRSLLNLDNDGEATAGDIPGRAPPSGPTVV